MDGSSTRGDVTRLLQRWSAGDRAALDDLVPIVYAELRRIAEGYFSRERSSHTLQPTALIHEAWMRMARQQKPVFDHRRQFYALAAQMMRRILVDHARQKARVRHGGGLERVDLDHVNLATEDNDATVLAIHEALEKLAHESPQKAEVVKLRYFTGMENQEIADALGISLSSVERSWAYARSWLHREMKKNLTSG